MIGSIFRFVGLLIFYGVGFIFVVIIFFSSIAIVDEFFIANGMDGELKLDKDIIPLNYWNINMLNEKEVFDTQKGIMREIKVEKLKLSLVHI